MSDGSNARRTSGDGADTIGTASRSTERIRSHGRLAAVLILAFAFAPSAWLVRLSAQSDAIIVTPAVSVMPPITIITVNDGVGAQLFPQVRGDLASFTDTPWEEKYPPLSYFRFSTGVTSRIPLGSAIADVWPAIDDGRITFTRFWADRSSVMLFDTITSALTEILPAADTARQMSAIGGNTLAFVDLRNVDGSFGWGDVVAYDITDTSSQRLTSTGPETVVTFPSVSPDGHTIVWANCPGQHISCGTMAAIWDDVASAWSVKTVSQTSAFGEQLADTDGTWITYSHSFSGVPTDDEDVYFVPVAGGSARRLALPGQQSYARISKGVISFTGSSRSFYTGDTTSIFLYVIATNALYQVTSADHHVGISDIDVLDSGDIRLVWAGLDDSAPESSWNIYATTFSVPLTTMIRTCLLYNPALVKKSGSAFPIKLRLCDGGGNNISAPSIAVHAVSVRKVSTSVVGQVDSTGNANPDLDFRYDDALAGYVFNLDTKGLGTGTYSLNLTVGSDPTLQSVPFAIK